MGNTRVLVLPRRRCVTITYLHVLTLAELGTFIITLVLLGTALQAAMFAAIALFSVVVLGLIPPASGKTGGLAGQVIEV
ncbi:hypothetical protein [Amycolatopsis sp. ATCC 39116]|uniref:hypothetical protein n=1 Tax=Amycolatopsis sp. (strain ATCC 39116 / 75iv2) TaxID=385957 RepID=UPI000378DB66|nr:hypothetical protein [Amycolatopsis sp. ATCC 39116]